MTEFKVGDEVIISSADCNENGKYAKIKEITIMDGKQHASTNLCQTMHKAEATYKKINNTFPPSKDGGIQL
jgi:hypothetical protein